MSTEADVREREEGYRSIEAAIHDHDDQNHEVVVDFPHEVLDSFRTDWAPGCWDDSLNKALPPMLWCHLPHEPIGIGVRSEKLPNATRIVNKFSDFDAVPRARQAFAQIQDGSCPGFSFHFRNARSIPHPNTRGARRFTQAQMLETSPVTFPSIPGAGAVGIRSGEIISDTAELRQLMDLDTILRLEKDGYIDSEGVRALIAEHYPSLRDHITVTTPSSPTQRIEAALRAQDEGLLEEFRHLIVIQPGSGATADDGTVTDDGEDDPTVLVRAIDSTLDHAAAAIGDMDVTELPDNVQQALSLMQAAGVAVDELQDVMGIDDPDDPLERGSGVVSNAPWNFQASKYTPEQLKAACLVVDGDGSTKDQCHLPVREPDGTLNRNAVHAAAGALAGARGGTKLSESDKQAAAKKLVGLYSTLGEKPPGSLNKVAGSGTRSDDLDGALGAALQRLDRRVASQLPS